MFKINGIILRMIKKFYIMQDQIFYFVRKNLEFPNLRNIIIYKFCSSKIFRFHI